MSSSLEQIAAHIRYDVISMCCQGRASHLASAWSCVDILTALYFGGLHLDPTDVDRDHVILSKGHAISALYATLAHRGFFPRAWLAQFNQEGSQLPEHAYPHCVPGIDFATGSLGHGLSVAVGHALGKQLAGQTNVSVAVLSDGECNEGSVWEAALFAPAKRVDRVIAIIDYNKWQGIDRSSHVLQLVPLKEKWEAFGWSTYEVDGHDIAALTKLFASLRLQRTGKPAAVIAHTVKGKGVPGFEDDNNWHYKVPSSADVERAGQHLGVS